MLVLPRVEKRIIEYKAKTGYIAEPRGSGKEKTEEIIR